MFTYTGPIRATKTVELINAKLVEDQGRLYRRYLRVAIQQVEDAYRDEEGPNFRSHLGASLVGKDCSRELWYTFRWAREVRHTGRLLRLFNRGHLEEARFIALLQMIGCTLWHHTAEGKQIRVSFHHGHFGGSVDSILHGIPDVEDNEYILGEYKTHNDKSYNKVEAEGVRSAKFEHYVQMQIYMGGLGLKKALYLAVNKDTDDIYGEIVPFDPEAFKRYLERGWIVITATEPPEKVNPSPGWFKCKMCDYRGICHYNEMPAKSCRTCIHATVGGEGQWFCSLAGSAIPKEVQFVGCSQYRWIPM